MSFTFFFRSLIVALLLSGGGLQAQPLVETYKRQEELRISIAKVCQSQLEKAQYRPVEGQEEDLRYMISAKGVQAIKAVVVPARSGGSYKCERGSYEQPMLLGRTYKSSVMRPCQCRKPLLFPSALCNEVVADGFLIPSECGVAGKERLELEPCVVSVVTLAKDSVDEDSAAKDSAESLTAQLNAVYAKLFKKSTIETSCLVSYTQADDGLVNRLILAFREPGQSK